MHGQLIKGVVSLELRRKWIASGIPIAGWCRIRNSAGIQPIAADSVDGDVYTLTHDVITILRYSTVVRRLLDTALRVVERYHWNPVSTRMFCPAFELNYFTRYNDVVMFGSARPPLKIIGYFEDRKTINNLRSKALESVLYLSSHPARRGWRMREFEERECYDIRTSLQPTHQGRAAPSGTRSECGTNLRTPPRSCRSAKQLGLGRDRYDTRPTAVRPTPRKSPFRTPTQGWDYRQCGWCCEVTS